MSMRLLVSVRNAAEAEAAAEAGADIIDVKDPANGPLGYAGGAEVQRIVETVAGRSPVSAALGECTEWLNSDDELSPPDDIDLRQSNLHFVKLGLAGTAVTDVSACRWRERWTTVRNGLMANLSAAPAWVAVAYADADRARSPEPAEVLKAAIETQCRAFLIDTYHKTGPGTLDCLSEAELVRMRETACQSGLQFALAGRITEHHLDAIWRIRPDILGVRGAVCESTNRNGRISGERIRQLLGRLKQPAGAASQ